MVQPPRLFLAQCSQRASAGFLQGLCLGPAIDWAHLVQVRDVGAANAGSRRTSWKLKARVLPKAALLTPIGRGKFTIVLEKLWCPEERKYNGIRGLILTATLRSRSLHIVKLTPHATAPYLCARAALYLRYTHCRMSPIVRYAFCPRLP